MRDSFEETLHIYSESRVARPQSAAPRSAAASEILCQGSVIPEAV